MSKTGSNNRNVSNGKSVDHFSSLATDNMSQTEGKK